MQLQALNHMANAASSLVPEVKIIVFGSASAFATFPELPEATTLYENTNDADFIIDPWSDELGMILSKCLGKNSAFFQMFGYYADIVRPAALDNFPPDFRERLVPLEGCPRVFALDPHDMAVAKLFAGRPKDIRLLVFLLKRIVSMKPRCAGCFGTRRWRRSGSCARIKCSKRWCGSRRLNR